MQFLLPHQRPATGLLLSACWLWLPGWSFACTLCIGFPETTDTDFLIDGHCVILARPSEDNPFSFAPRQVLKGTFDGVEINLLVDSMTRRVLAAKSKQSVVLVQQGAGGKWRNLGIASDAYLSVIRRILMLGAAWSEANEKHQRWQFFVPLFGHDDARIRQLAYLELSRAPFSVIRKIGQAAPRDSYDSLLSDPKYIKWRSLAILLLAQSDAAQDKQLVRDNFRSAHRLSMTTNLSAWTAAVIEVDGSSAIALIDDNYGRQTHRSLEEVRAVLKALSMHGSQDEGPLRDRIVTSYRELLRSHPRIAPEIATDLFTWKRHDLHRELAATLKNGARFEPIERQLIDRYLRAAATRSSAAEPSTTSEELALVPD